jgi:hypothetical protein
LAGTVFFAADRNAQQNTIVMLVLLLLKNFFVVLVLCIQFSVCVSYKHSIQDELDVQNLIGFEGNSRLSAGNFTEAEKAFRTIVRVSPKAWPAHYSLAVSLLNQCRCTQHTHVAAMNIKCEHICILLN